MIRSLPSESTAPDAADQGRAHSVLGRKRQSTGSCVFSDGRHIGIRQLRASTIIAPAPYWSGYRSDGRDVTPKSAVGDIGDVSCGDTVMFGNVYQRRSRLHLGSYNLDVFVCQSCARMFAALWPSAMKFCVIHIAAMRIPTQVFKFVVGWVSIVVAALVSWFAWPYEGKQDEPVDEHVASDSLHLKSNPKVSLAVDSWFQRAQFSALHGEYSPVRRYEIVREVSNRLQSVGVRYV
jgi:hypothetical protein